MRARRFQVTNLHVDGAPVPVKYGDLVVVAHEGAEDLDWECVVSPVGDDRPLEQGAYHLQFTTLEGRELAGDAVLVRSVAGTHVLRGAGPLAGFSDDELPDERSS